MRLRLSDSSNKAWVAIDQATSSATNFAGAALAAGLLSAVQFGAWSIAFTVMLTVVTASRNWSGDALLVVVPRHPAEFANRLAAGAVTLNLAIGVIAGLGVGVVATMLKGGVQSSLLALAVCLPAVLVQDAVRYVLLTTNRGREATANDGLWMVLAIAALMAQRRTDTAIEWLAVLALFGTAVPSALWGVGQIGVVPTWSAMVTWWSQALPLMWRMTLEFIVFTVSGLTMVLAVIALSAPIEDVGFVRSAQTMLGPLTVLFAATVIYVQPKLAADAVAGQPMLRRGFDIAVLNGAAAIGWTALIWLIPDVLGIRVFGASWSGARELVWLMGIFFALSGVSLGAASVFRAQHRIQSSIVLRAVGLLIVAPVTILAAARSDSERTFLVFVAASAITPAVQWAWLLFRPSSGSTHR